MKKSIILLLAVFSILLCKAQVSIQLATGMYSNNTPIPHGDADDTWRVQTPSGLNKDAKVCYANPGWVNGSGCSRWITPYIKVISHNPENCVVGMYIFKTSFNYSIDPCVPVTSVILNLNMLAGDNDVQTFRINGHAYPIRPGLQDFSSFTSQTVTINPADLISGINNIEILVNNSQPNYVSGLNICGVLNINAAPAPLQPSFNASPSYCQGALTFVGSDGAGTATSNTWDLIECNANGVPVTNGNSFSSGILPGAPGVFNFANQSLMPCNRYYLVRLTIDNNCQIPVSVSHVIYMACNPVNAGPDLTVACPGNCVQIGTPAQGGYLYRWTNSGGTVIGNTAIITVCPVSTSTYTLTVTNQAFNCSSSNQVTVFVTGTNNPTFILDTFNTATHVTCTANPLVTNANTVPGFGEMYIVEEINPSTGQTIAGTKSSQGNNPNPPCWWIYPATLTFKGYNGTQNVATNANCHLVTPVPGRFTLCRTYRITRGTWNNNCPWRQYSVQFTCYCPLEPLSRVGGNFEIKETTAPDYSYLQPGHLAMINETRSDGGIVVYPNPGPGIFTVAASAFNSGTLTVYNQVGSVIKRMQLPNKRSNISIDLSGEAPGTYIVKIESNGKIYKEKLLLLK